MCSTDTPLRCGVDIVAISRIDTLLDEFRPSFQERVYTAPERRYCDRQPHPAQHYAARWAAKEAFLKAIGPYTDSVPPHAIGVTRVDADPQLALADQAQTAAEAAIAADCSPAIATDVSLSHDRAADYAAGQVVLYRGGHS